MAISPHEMKYLYGDRGNKKKEVSMTSKRLVGDVKILNKKFNSFFNEEKISEIDMSYRVFNGSLRDLSKDMDEVLRGLNGAKREYNAIAYEEAQLGTWRGMFGKKKKKADIESRKEMLAKRIAYLTGVAEDHLDRLGEIEGIGDGLFEFKDKVDGVRRDFNSHKLYLDNLSVTKEFETGERKILTGNFDDLSLEYLRQMDEWGRDSKLSGKEAYRTVKGDSFLQDDLENRVYSGKRNYFQQAKNDWQKIYSDEDVEEVLKMYRNHKTLNRISKRIGDSEKTIKNYRSDLESTLSSLRNLDFN